MRTALTVMVALLGILLVTGFAALLESTSSATPAFADGALFPDTDRDIYQPAQKAIIDYAEGRQDMILQIKYEGDVDEFAWVVPVPSYPTINVSDAYLFEWLAELTAVWVPGGGGFFECNFDAPGDEEKLVDVWEEDTVGIYDYAILSAEDPTALIDWLNTNGYIFPEEGQEIVNHYIDNEWYFVAVKINPSGEAEGLAEGTIQPLKLSFDTDKIIYPLEITSLSSRKCEVLLYIFADQRVVPQNYQHLTLTTEDQVEYFKRKDDVFYLEYAKPYDEYAYYDHDYSRFAPPSEGGDYLTKMRANINNANMVDIELIRYEEGNYMDSDGDGWSDAEELVAGTDPDNTDTDDDDLSDPEDTYPIGQSGVDDWLIWSIFWITILTTTAMIVGYTLWRRRRRADGTIEIRDNARD